MTHKMVCLVRIERTMYQSSGFTIHRYATNSNLKHMKNLWYAVSTRNHCSISWSHRGRERNRTFTCSLKLTAVLPLDDTKSGRESGIRTHDLLNPNQARYQATLPPDESLCSDSYRAQPDSVYISAAEATPMPNMISH